MRLLAKNSKRGVLGKLYPTVGGLREQRAVERNTEAAEIIVMIRPGTKTLLVRTSNEKIAPLKINIHVKVVSTVQDIWQAFNKYLKLKLKFRRIPEICSSQLVRTAVTLYNRTARRYVIILKDQENRIHFQS